MSKFKFMFMMMLLLGLARPVTSLAAPRLSDPLPFSEVPVLESHSQQQPLPSVDVGGDITIMATAHITYIAVAGDEEYRALYGGGWTTAANNALEQADNAMASNWGIDFRSHHYANWDSVDSQHGMANLLSELRAEIALSGADFRQGYTNQTANARGIAYILGRSSLVRHTNDTADWKVTQHETSHIFGALDRYNDSSHNIRCVMDSADNDYNIWCSTQPWADASIMATNAGRFR